MQLPDNSDAACLIKADWLEEHDQVAEALWLREDVAEGPHVGGVGGVGGFGFSISFDVADGGAARINGIGTSGLGVGGIGVGRVGGGRGGFGVIGGGDDFVIGGHTDGRGRFGGVGS